MISIILGLTAMVAGLYGMSVWSQYLLALLKGLFPIGLFCAGLVACIAGISSLLKK